jgi:hypothetical protein
MQSSYHAKTLNTRFNQIFLILLFYWLKSLRFGERTLTLKCRNYPQQELLLAIASTLQQKETLLTFVSMPQQELEEVSSLLAEASFASGPQQLP